MNANQKDQVTILRKKIKENPSSPKVVKWKALIAQTEKAGISDAKSIKSKLTPQVKEVHNQVLKSCEDQELKIRKEYLHTVLYPDAYSYRMPDELTQPTNLYRSIREFNLMCNLDGTKNSGRFSFAVTPKLGATTLTTNYQTGIIDSSTGWPENLTAPEAYLTNSLGTDPRVDPMAAQMTSGPLGYKYLSNSLGNIPATAAHTTVQNFLPLDTNVNTLSSGDMVFEFAPIPNNIVVGAYSIRPNNTGNYAFLVGDGTYTFSPIFTARGSWNAAGNPTYLDYRVGILEFRENNGEYLFTSQLFLSRTATSATGFFGAGNSRVVYEHMGDLWSTSQGELFDMRVNLRLRSGFLYVPFFSFVTSGSTNNVNNVNYGFTLTNTTDEGMTNISNSGSIIKMRPIACSALVTCTLPQINAGGSIVAYSASPSDINNYYYNISSTLGPLQNWENLARLNKGKQIHDGNFIDGAYVWTQPWDKMDCLLRTPIESQVYGYQGIIVSGQLNPSVTLSGMVNAGRIRICIIYEYITDNRLFDPQSCIGSTADLDWVLAYLGQQQHATGNPDHMKKILDILKRSTAFIRSSVPYVISGMEALTGFTSLLV